MNVTQEKGTFHFCELGWVLGNCTIAFNKEEKTWPSPLGLKDISKLIGFLTTTNFKSRHRGQAVPHIKKREVWYSWHNPLKWTDLVEGNYKELCNY